MGSRGHAHVNFPPLAGVQGCSCLSPQKWRPFCLRFEGVVEDFNYGTLLRLDCRKDYTEENTIFGERGPAWHGTARLGEPWGRLEPAPSPRGKGKGRTHGFVGLSFSSLLFPSHQNPVFRHRNRSEQRGL